MVDRSTQIPDRPKRTRILTLLLTEHDVRGLVPVGLMVDAVERAFAEHGLKQASNFPRIRIVADRPGGSGAGPSQALQVMSGSVPELHAAGVKAYSGGWPGGMDGAVLLFDTQSGQLEAIVAAAELGRLRTGAASAVATKYMARREASTLAVLGTGLQARSQVDAIVTVRPIDSILVYSPTPKHRLHFAQEVNEALGISSTAVASAEEATETADIIVTATPSREPVLEGRWVPAGAHINAIGANWAPKREIDAEVVRRAALVVVDALDQAEIEAGDLISAEREGAFTWSEAIELGTIVAGKAPSRRDDGDITLFESQGVALADLAAARLLSDAARRVGAGRDISLG